MSRRLSILTFSSEDEAFSLSSLSNIKSVNNFYSPQIMSTTDEIIDTAQCSKGVSSPLLVKQYPYKHSSPSINYLSQSRTLKLKHPNVLQILEVNDQGPENTSNSDVKSDHSSIVFESASYGNIKNIKFLYPLSKDEALARTYFHQLINALSYIHESKVAHLDIIPENIFIGDDFNIKVTNFDHCCFEDDVALRVNDIKTPFAPELKQKKEIKDPKVCDIYNAGLILFLLRIGSMPYKPNAKQAGFFLEDYLENKPEQFFKVHPMCVIKQHLLNDDFKELFFGMTAKDPSKRPSIEEIRNSKWFKGPTYSYEQLRDIMKKSVQPVVIVDDSFDENDSLDDN